MSRIPRRSSRQDDVRALSGRVFLLLGTLLVIVAGVVGLAERGIDAMRSDVREQSNRDIPAIRLLLNIDRDAYQAQLGLERYVHLSADHADTTEPLAMWTENSQQVVARWEQFTAVQHVDAEEQARSAAFERDRATWLADAQRVLQSAPSGQEAALARTASSFDVMRDHLDVLEEQFYEPLIAQRAAAADSRAARDQRRLLSGLVLLLVLGLGLGVRTARQATRIGQSFVAREAEVLEASEQQRFETSAHRALESAPDEPAVNVVLSRALRIVEAGRHSSLLLADASNAHLEATLTHGEARLGCPVGVPGRCPAVTRGNVQRFPDSDALDSCHYLSERGEGGLGALCIPLSIGGRTTGVLHTVHDADQPLDTSTANRLVTLANHVGTRLGVLRAFAATSLQAERDSLTGLLNRRALEANVTELERHSDPEAPLSLAMADLDMFKRLNDTHGHQAGDRALRLFSSMLREHVRDGDLVCRWGGEEFLIVLPGTTAEVAMQVVERLRAGLATELGHADVPAFSVSVGVAEGRVADGFDALVERADRALYQAKKTGRDRAYLASVPA